MKVKEFRELVDKEQPKWFELFDINCKKCKSKNIEIAGDCECEDGYYDSWWGRLVIKCHNCGNAKVFKLENDYNTDENDNINILEETEEDKK